jgi:hypothetical protein
MLLLRLDPAVHDALARWAADELRSTNAQIEFLLQRALTEAARLPAGTSRRPRRGRSPQLTDGTAMDTDGAALDGDEAGMLPGAGHSAREGRHESRR